MRRGSWVVVSVAAAAAVAAAARRRAPAQAGRVERARPLPPPRPEPLEPSHEASATTAGEAVRPASTTDGGTILVREMEAPAIAVVDVHAARNGDAAPATATATASPATREPITVPRSMRLSGVTLAVIAAGASATAIALGTLAFVLSVTGEDGDGATVGAVEASRAVTLLATPGARRFPVAGSVGRIVLVVAPRGDGALVLDGLGAAASGSSYQAWVTPAGSGTPRSAAVFDGSELVVPLTVPVPPGATVAVTLERRGGVTAPTREPRLVARRSA